jgi:hypothetical protein
VTKEVQHGQQRRLYRETLMKYMVSSQYKPHNYPLYSFHLEIDSFILYNDGDMERQMTNLENDVYNIEENTTTFEENETIMVDSDKQNEPLWSLDFDGIVSKQGSGVAVWVSYSIKNH